VVSVVQLPEPADIAEVDAMIDAGTKRYAKLFAELKGNAKVASIPIETEVLVGHPADQLVHYAAEKQCNMVLIGQRGKSRIEQWLLGSISKGSTPMRMYGDNRKIAPDAA
jgi:nucleotide-binding universal stress UspA family protein